MVCTLGEVSRDGGGVGGGGCMVCTLGEVSGDGGGVGGGLQLLALLSVQPLLVPVDVDDVLSR